MTGEGEVMTENGKDRRNDVGLKVIYTVLSALIIFLLGILFTVTYGKADSAYIMGADLDTRVTVIEKVLETSQKETNRRLEILDVKTDKILEKVSK